MTSMCLPATARCMSVLPSPSAASALAPAASLSATTAVQAPTMLRDPAVGGDSVGAGAAGICFELAASRFLHTM